MDAEKKSPCVPPALTEVLTILMKVKVHMIHHITVTGVLISQFHTDTSFVARFEFPAYSANVTRKMMVLEDDRSPGSCPGG